MIPWPIALLSVFYGVIATSSASVLWQIAMGQTHRALIWQVMWFGLSAGATCGLALLKPWGRRLAIWTSILLMVVMLSIAGLLTLVAREPLLGLVMTLGASLHVLVMRYLGRPSVKAYFAEQIVN